jgi:cysteine desulfuration protein SufE
MACAMSETFEKKCIEIKKKFEPLSPEKRYQLLMDMGKGLKPYLDVYKTPKNLVSGCQSILYLRSFQEDGKIFFEAQADALISAGLAALLVFLYSGETVETILKNSPVFIEELGIGASLSMNRSNGLSNILLKIKQESLSYLTIHALD